MRDTAEGRGRPTGSEAKRQSFFFTIPWDGCSIEYSIIQRGEIMSRRLLDDMRDVLHALTSSRSHSSISRLWPDFFEYDVMTASRFYGFLDINWQGL